MRNGVAQVTEHRKPTSMTTVLYTSYVGEKSFCTVPGQLYCTVTCYFLSVIRNGEPHLYVMQIHYETYA